MTGVLARTDHGAMCQVLVGLGGYHGVERHPRRFIFRNANVTNKETPYKIRTFDDSHLFFIASSPPRSLAPHSLLSRRRCTLVGLVALTMKISIFSAVSAALFVAGVSAQLTVNTP